MKKSLFKGHLINTDTSKNIFKANAITENLQADNAFNQKVEFLEAYGIRDWEQLYALLQIPLLRENLKTTLHITSDSELDNLKEICINAIPDYRLAELDNADTVEFPLGTKRPLINDAFAEKFKAHNYLDFTSLIKSEQKLNEVNAYDLVPNFSLANSVNHIPQLNDIKSQGQERGTCTSFAVTAANEFAHYVKTGARIDLSEQHLYYEVKEYEADGVCGAWVENTMQIISYKGQCLENIWSYNPNLPCVQNYGKPSNADENALRYKNVFFKINPTDIAAIKQALSSRKIIPFCVDLFDSWYYSAECIRTGGITMPLDGEIASSLHTMVYVGYQDDARWPGGGYFIIRNSWGKEWGRDNYYGAGYGVIPYEYIINYALEAFAF